jgi:hypothetical protein
MVGMLFEAFSGLHFGIAGFAALLDLAHSDSYDHDIWKGATS